MPKRKCLSMANIGAEGQGLDPMACRLTRVRTAKFYGSTPIVFVTFPSYTSAAISDVELRELSVTVHGTPYLISPFSAAYTSLLAKADVGTSIYGFVPVTVIHSSPTGPSRLTLNKTITGYLANVDAFNKGFLQGVIIYHEDNSDNLGPTTDVDSMVTNLKSHYNTSSVVFQSLAVCRRLNAELYLPLGSYTALRCPSLSRSPPETDLDYTVRTKPGPNCPRSVLRRLRREIQRSSSIYKPVDTRHVEIGNLTINTQTWLTIPRETGLFLETGGRRMLSRNLIALYVANEATPEYINNYGEFISVLDSMQSCFISVFTEQPEYVLPLGESLYYCDITEH
ncbi:hypothetical protein ASPSYDRAFT_1162271 [Aspergillus sydowii CBS 593.65]|uniref:Scytalone dehydratase-like protein Arp1 N-terminal domain-containing protein n=1 Tax=Aspergillus sydowii CBS 593.65 TaxID=1036612 RepID=A0A1L9T435_9EURO|nr:uncharacterized protein ASPSYDRAFT_1162271 [Aspergillus sydowii CBS 593.65]OJJ54210.1 hypothetical protein ASPSYDRAFT_1162271 [Aspergillus sydowii CBS 593.65]